MNPQIATIARYTLLEGMRTRLPSLVVATLLTLVAASLFMHELAVIESSHFQTAFYAATMRLACVFIAALYVLTSVAREFNEKGLEVLLALDLPRSNYILGKLAGFVAIGILLSAAACVPLAILTSPVSALQWASSLSVELAVVIALALFCALTFSQIMPAASFILAFYLLARSLEAIRLIAASPLSATDALSHQVMHGVIEGLALVLPSFDSWTQTAWLVEHPAAWFDIGLLLGQATLYVVLLTAAATFDFYRKNL
jgi:ABC-type transport system involved in multi-copper enzyme maturation permease subunit